LGLICPNNNNVTKKKLQEERTKEMLKKIKSWKTKIMKYIKGNETEEIFFVETRFEDRIIRCRMKYGEVISMPVGGIKIQKKAE
jgi:hypothetical protein